jgi:two-component system, NarL family, invasion response regulator UvrY
MLRILHKDDHPIVRIGVKGIVQSRIPQAIVDEAGDAVSTLEKIRSNIYQLVILDVSHPGTDAFQLITNILKINPQMKILLFSMYDEESNAKRFFQLGVKGFIRKDASTEEVGDAISHILNDSIYINSVHFLLCYTAMNFLLS